MVVGMAPDKIKNAKVSDIGPRIFGKVAWGN
jgi:hypothetical protein